MVARNELVMNSNTLNTNKKRIEWVDMLKGVAIICVVIGHGYYSGNIALLFKAEIYSFHIPLFFFLSGVVFSIDKYESFKGFIIKKIKIILVPMVLFSFVGIIFDYIYYGLVVGIEKYGIHYLVNRCIGIVLQLRDGKFESKLWFLTCLFIVQVLLYWIVKLSKDNTKIIFLVISFSFVVGAIYMFFGLPLLPWEIDCALIGLFFVGLGYLFKKEQILDKIRGKIWLAIILIAINFSAMFINYFYMGKRNIDLVGNQLGIPILYLLESVSSVIALVIIFAEIKRIRPLSYIGKNSLVYYGLLDVMVFIPNIIVYNVLVLDLKSFGGWTILINFIIAAITCLCIVPINELISRKLKFMKGQF